MVVVAPGAPIGAAVCDVCCAIAVVDASDDAHTSIARILRIFIAKFS
jgi:hypothetical protein